jgi:hypothetical protein
LFGRSRVCDRVEVRTFVGYPDVFQAVVQVLEPLVIAGVETVFAEHLEFSLGDLFGFFELHGVQLNGRVVLLLTIDNLDIYLAALRCLLVLVILLGALLLLRSVLLGNFILHDVDGTAF